MPSLLHKVALQQSSSSSAAGQNNGDGGRSSGGAVWTRSNTEDVSLSQLHKVLFYLRPHAASSLCHSITLWRWSEKSKSILSVSGALFISIGIIPSFLHPLSDIQIFRCRYWTSALGNLRGISAPVLVQERGTQFTPLLSVPSHLELAFERSELLGIGDLTDWNRILWRAGASFVMPHVIFRRKCVAHLSLCDLTHLICFYSSYHYRLKLVCGANLSWTYMIRLTVD